MPIEKIFTYRSFSQAEFRKVSYEVTGLAFDVHNKIGRIFHESNYEVILGHLLQERAIQQANIRLSHGGFRKDYFIDLLVDEGCPFELKTVSNLNDRHRAQLIQYLMMTNLQHGTIINFGKEKVEHAFVNCHVSSNRRLEFQLDLSRWDETTTDAARFREFLVGVLRDWGTGLDRTLYAEAVAYAFGGLSSGHRLVKSYWNGKAVGQQQANLIGCNTAFEITCLRDNMHTYEQQLVRFLDHTSLEMILWSNIIEGRVQFVLLRKNAGSLFSLRDRARSGELV